MVFALKKYKNYISYIESTAEFEHMLTDMGIGASHDHDHDHDHDHFEAALATTDDDHDHDHDHIHVDEYVSHWVNHHEIAIRQLINTFDQFKNLS